MKFEVNLHIYKINNFRSSKVLKFQAVSWNYFYQSIDNISKNTEISYSTNKIN